MKFWITKYALTKGVYSIDGEVHPTIGKGQLLVGLHHCGVFHGEGREWHRTREAAVVRANQMRLAKIKSLQKQLAGLQDEFK